MEFKFERNRSDKIPKEKIIAELQRVAKIYNFKRFGKREYDKVATVCKSNCVRKCFGSWNKALDSIGIPLEKKYKYQYSSVDLFSEMERVWKAVGHRPSRVEWERSQPIIAYITYKKRFGGWTSACLKFIEYKMGNSVQLDCQDKMTKPEITLKDGLVKKEKRDIPLRLRLLVLKKYDFKCAFCGRSPAIDKGVILHIDHIIPVAKGGKTDQNNLRTLCKECNLGKSDLTV